jgi:hypothetical protein
MVARLSDRRHRVALTKLARSISAGKQDGLDLARAEDALDICGAEQ